jgi:diketogulonate reductase-like aldo/keto reductase
VHLKKIPTIKLNTRMNIPSIGFGTWQIEDGKPATNAVIYAIEAGYRLIDTAKVYGNEKSVGEGIKKSGVAREDLFITTKLWNNDQGYESALDAFEQSLDRLGLEYLDLYLIHWPATDQRAASWKALQEIYKSGKAKAVGVSNYTVRHLEELLEESKVVPAVNQVEFHPYIYEQQKELLEYCAEKNIVVEAYSPLARARDMDNTKIIAIAQRHAKTPAQIMLRWAIQHNTVPIPKSESPERIKENINVFDFELSSEEMEILNSLANGNRVTWDPSIEP